jgi:DNA polymerase-3 subunit delta'
MTRVLLDEVLAQPTAVGTLQRALASGRVHHAYLFDGPDGVGKELAAFGLAQALVCERRAPGGDRACGECSACKRAIPNEEDRRPRHPDVVAIERGLYDPAAIGRGRTPETQEISIDQVRTLVLARSAFPPHEGRAKVFVIRRAEELSISAANALLKTLEEPGAATHFVLLTSHRDALLSTILSRTQRVRFGALPDAVLEKLLEARGVAGAREVARLAGGSMTQAMVLADPDEGAKRAAFVERAMKAARDGDLGLALDLAEDAKKGSREALATEVRAFAAALAAAARAAAGDRTRDDADLAAARYRIALEALRELEWNASPQLVVEAMLTRMKAPFDPVTRRLPKR